MKLEAKLKELLNKLEDLKDKVEGKEDGEREIEKTFPLTPELKAILKQSREKSKKMEELAFAAESLHNEFWAKVKRLHGYTNDYAVSEDDQSINILKK